MDNISDYFIDGSVFWACICLSLKIIPIQLDGCYYSWHGRSVGAYNGFGRHFRIII